MYYKNKKGTGERDCKCGSWKQHWINFSNESWPAECSVLGCSDSATLGAHIYHVGSPKEYIVPACDGCNKRGDAFSLKSGTVKVSSNTSKTCDK